MRNIIIFLSILLSISLAQETDVSIYLKQIEKGQIVEANKVREKLLQSKPNDPSVIFLDAVLTVDGNEAFKKYEKIYSQFPKSKYADAALYRAYCYKYSIGLYIAASKLYEQLKIKYPNSPYLKNTYATAILSTQDDMPKQNLSLTIEKDSLKEITPEKDNPQPKEEFKFTIQLGAFLKKSNAENLAKKIKESGYETYFGNKRVAGADLIIVYYGKFKRREEAVAALSRIEKDLNIVGRISAIE